MAGPTVEIVGDRGAVVSWQTDVPTAGRFRYGTAPLVLDRHRTGEVSAAHRVALTNLVPGTRYFFSISTSRQLLATNSFVIPGPGEPRPAEGVDSGSGRQPVANAGTNTSGSNATVAVAPPAAKTWGSPATLADHFARHGRDFRARDAEDYARLAWEFRERARREGLPAKVDDDDGTVRIYERGTRTFGAYRRDGRTRTFFKPESPTYFERQPGRPVDSRTLRFP